MSLHFMSIFLVAVAEGPVAVQHRQLQLAIGTQLLLRDLIPGGKHLADLHKGFVAGLRDDKDGVEGHGQADGAEDQVAVGAHGQLWQEDKQHVSRCEKSHFIQFILAIASQCNIIHRITDSLKSRGLANISQLIGPITL